MASDAPAVSSASNKLPDATWIDVLGEVASLPKAPILIVLSPLADDLLWAEVLNLGGYDMLIKSFDSGEGPTSSASPG